MAFQYLNNRPLDEARTQYLALLQEGYETVYQGPECLIFDLEANR